MTILYFISQTIFLPSARILPRILPKSFRKILPRNPSTNAYSALKILPRDPSAKILPRRSANKKVVYFFGSFRSLPQNPSAEPFHKCLFCIENPSAESFRKDPSAKIGQQKSSLFFWILPHPSAKSFRGTLPQMFILH